MPKEAPHVCAYLQPANLYQAKQYLSLSFTFVPTNISHTSSDNEIFTAVVLDPDPPFVSLINISAGKNLIATRTYHNSGNCNLLYIIIFL